MTTTEGKWSGTRWLIRWGYWKRPRILYRWWLLQRHGSICAKCAQSYPSPVRAEFALNSMWGKVLMCDRCGYLRLGFRIEMVFDA